MSTSKKQMSLAQINAEETAILAKLRELKSQKKAAAERTELERAKSILAALDAAGFGSLPASTIVDILRTQQRAGEVPDAQL